MKEKEKLFFFLKDSLGFAKKESERESERKSEKLTEKKKKINNFPIIILFMLLMLLPFV